MARFCGRCGLFGVALLALALAGCGRRGNLDPPPDVPASQVEPMQVKPNDPMAGDPIQPGQRVATPAAPSAASNGKTFLLDPLVK